MAKTIKVLANLDTQPEIDTPDPKERTLIIFNGYPSAQCRIDTMYSGSLCHKSHNQLLDMNLYNKGNCSTENGDIIGNRPRCWYVERSDLTNE